MGIKKIFTKEGEIRTLEIVGNKVLAIFTIGDKLVCNPTIAQIEEDGWREIIQPIPEPLLPTIEQLVERKLRERYTINQEFEVNRKRETDPQAFAVYYDYVEECIAWAKEQPHKEEE